MSATLTIKIKRDGDVQVDVSGVPGATCTNLTDALVAGLGEIEERCYTSEFEAMERPDWLETHEGDEE